MKRFITLALATAFIFGCAAMAGAVELKLKGEFQVHGEFDDNPSLQSNNSQGFSVERFTVQQRMRNYFEFVANENLKAVWGVEIGTNTWGFAGGNVGKSTGAGLDTDGVNVETKWAYLDFNVPGTTANVKVGMQALALPSAFNSTSAIMDFDAPALVTSTPFNDMVALTLGWTRIGDLNTGFNGDSANRRWDEADVIFAALPITPDKGLSFTPFGAYAIIGKDIASTSDITAGGDSSAIIGANNTQIGTARGAFFSTGRNGLIAPVNPNGSASDETQCWWGGMAMEVKMFDPFAFYADFNWGSERNKGADLDRSGWLADAMVEYKGLEYVGTPTLFGMYSSGEDSATGKSKRMPSVQNYWSPNGSFFYSGTQFDALNADIGGNLAELDSTEGTWNVGLGLYGMSFIEKLTHDLVFIYIGGSNSRSSIPLLLATQYSGVLTNSAGVPPQMPLYSLTDKDHLYEIDFNHQYQIFENLTAIVELGCIIPDFDKSTTGYSAWDNATSNQKTAYRAIMGFKYKY